MSKKNLSPPAPMALPREPGTYVLVLYLDTAQLLVVGALGERTFPPGWYTYVGSAHGSGGLAARLRHHLAENSRQHWHIDYLRQVATIQEIWYTVSANRLEASWATILANLPGAAAIPRFGSTDSKCASHLFHWQRKPSAPGLPARIIATPAHQGLASL